MSALPPAAATPVLALALGGAAALLPACGRAEASPPPAAAEPAPAPAPPAAPLNFNRDVRPILSDKCFYCHGPDEKKRDSGLRLDQFATATAPNAKSGHVPFVPGKPEASEAWRRITTADEDDMMPPRKSGKSLSEAEKSVLKRWIAEGAKYEAHWAFVPVAAPPVPKVKDAAWVKNPVDAFILARLEAEGIAPSPEADKAHLLRRVSLDLTGLPPSPQETEAFLADTAPDAYEKQVDRLLSSPRRGEHLAMGWMDVARYGDTDGFQYDRTRTMWPWRDWVASAYNRDLPFDQFVTWQLAGDLLQGATPEQVLASGFNRNHMLNNEGGRDAKENRVDYVVDRTVTTGTAFLGLTLDCCRCHDHKFDPIATKEFYQLSAYFDQVDEDGAFKSWGPRADFDTGAYGKQTTLVMKDLPPAKWRKTFILERGEWDKHGAEVQAGVPASLAPALPADAPKNRLALAQWLTAPENPLLARVEANRQWQRFFGFGLTRTPDDFGLQGEYPSHPELLDHLAASFVADGWSLKRLQRRIVTSATYRQASALRADLAERDPLNRLLARQNRFRLPSAVLRDQALAVSGRLIEQVGGPPFIAPQPPGMWEEVTNNAVPYRPDAGPQVRRRSLYMFWRRLSAPASLFDISIRQVCQVRTITTNTPLQALALLNDPVYAGAARALAAKAMREGGRTPAEQLAFALRRALARSVTDDEVAPILAGHRRLLEHYQAHPDDAEKVCRPPAAEPLPPAKLGPGIDPIKPGAWPAFQAPPETPAADPADRAAWAAMTGTCAVILNLDETLTRE